MKITIHEHFKNALETMEKIDLKSEIDSHVHFNGQKPKEIFIIPMFADNEKEYKISKNKMVLFA